VFRAILVDSNEPELVRDLLKSHGILFTVQKLETADYVFGNVGIERKTVDDFWASMTGKRLFGESGQCKRLGDNFEIPIIALIGSIGRLYVKNPGWIASTMRKIMLSYQIPVCPFATEDDFVRFLVSMVHHPDEIGTFEPVYRKQKGEMNITAKMLMQIPGVGVKRATDIAEKYTFEDIFTAVEFPLDVQLKVEGVGKKTWETIFDALYRSD